MSRALVLVALTGCAQGRVYATKTIHVGVRPAAATDGVGITVQLSVKTPW